MLSEVHLNALKKFLSLIHIIVVYLEISGLNRKFSLYTVIQKLPLIYYGTNNFTFSTMYTLKARHYVLHAVFFTFFMVLTRKICLTSKSELLLLAIISFSFVTLLIDLTAMFTTGEI